MNNNQGTIDRLLGTLQRIRIPLLVGTILFILILVALLVYVDISSTRREESVRTVEELKERLDEWETTLDQDPEELAAIRQELQDVITKYPKEYGASSALFILGNTAWDEEEYEEAATKYLQLAADFPTNHLSPIALYNAASALQNIDQTDQSVHAYERIVADYPDSIVVPQALFSLARIAEGKDEYETAMENYQAIIDDYSASKWSNLAHTKKIQLIVDQKVDKPVEAVTSEESEEEAEE